MGTGIKVGKFNLILASLFVVIVALNPPATHYERSVYLALPTVGWVIFYVTLVSVTVLMGIAIYGENSNCFKYGVVSALVTFFGFFMIPFSRGYYLNSGYKADTLYHLGVVRSILSMGELSTLTYPGTHIIITSLQLLTNIQLNHIPWLISFVFFALFILSIHSLSASLARDRGVMIAITLASFTLLFAKYRYEVMPWMYAVPYIFFLVISAKHILDRRQLEWVLLFILFVITISMYHPFTALYGCLALGGYLAIEALEDGKRQFTRVGVTLSAIFMIVLLTWHVILGTVAGHLGGAILRLIESGGPATQTSSDAGAVGYTIAQYLSRFIIPVWGDIIYYGFIGGLVSLYIFIAWYRDDATTIEKFVASQYAIGAVVGSGVLVLGFFGDSIRRAAQYPILMSIFAVGIGLYKIIQAISRANNSQRRAVIALGLVVLLIAPAIVFSASTTYAPDRHVTEKAAAGHGWQLDYKDPSNPIVARPEGGRFADYYLGYQAARENRDSDEIVFNTRAPPAHLGYNDSSSISASLDYSEESYLITKTGDWEWYFIEPEWRHGDLTYYTEDDREKLATDPTANRVYSNSGLDVWHIESAGTEDQSEPENLEE